MITLEARPGSATERTRHDRRSRSSILGLGVFLLGCMAAPTEAMNPLAPAQLTFEQHEIGIGAANHPTVLPGFFLGGATAELVVVRIDGNDDRRVEMYGFDDGAWVAVLEAKLGPGVLFVDVANIGGRDRLITYEPGRLTWFDPESATRHELVEVGTSYNATPAGLRYAGAEPMGPSHKGEIPHVDITRDLNRDGRDDLIVPDIDGFWISTQSSNGSFTDAVKLGPAEPFLDEIAFDDRRSYGEVGISALTIPWYLSRVHELDYDQDGRSDLVFWNQDHFDVHHQNEHGLFDPVAKSFAADVPFDADGAYSLLFGFDEESTFSLLVGFRKNTKRTVLHSFRDLNGDGVADLVTQTLEGRSLLKQRSLYEVYFGRRAPDGTLFASKVSTSIRPPGRRPGGLQHSGYSSQRLQDLDGDGQVDMVQRDVKMGVGTMLRTLVGNSISLDLELYRSKDGVYPDKPTVKRRIRPRFRPLAGLGNIFFPAVLMGDVNGDGRLDLLVGQSPKELRVFVGVPGPDLLARQPQKVAVALPYDERNTWLVDLDKDGRQDLLIHRGPTGHAPNEPHRLTTLIAR